MLAKYSSIIRNYVLSVSPQRKYNFYHRTNSRNIIGWTPLMVTPFLANQNMAPMLIPVYCVRSAVSFSGINSSFVLSYVKLPNLNSHFWVSKGNFATLMLQLILNMIGEFHSILPLLDSCTLVFSVSNIPLYDLSSSTLQII